jgi:formylglycine-generating enzyme required for sulfatase activity/tetratricopeptide (TPR) repeat protein
MPFELDKVTVRARAAFARFTAFARRLEPPPWLFAFAKRIPLARSTQLVTLLAIALGFVPSLSGPSYPSALTFGLLVPQLTAIATACLNDPSRTPEQMLGLRLERAGAHALALTIPLVLHALRTEWCAPGHDLTVLFLGPLMGLFMAAAWGHVVALGAARWLGGSIRTRFWLGWLGPLGSALLGVVAFYRSPMVFAFDPFVGFFAGSIYDTGFDPTFRLLTYRLGSAASLLVLLVISRHLSFGPDRRPRLAPKPRDRALLVLGFLGFVCSVAVTTNGVALGHRSTESSIREALGHSVRLERCEVVYGRQKAVAIRRLTKDCNAWLSRLERGLGARRLDGVTVFVFDDANQKELLMGAAHTQIAKPWRKEIYLNGAVYPNDVVGHELAHLVGGQVAGGPFAVAGSFFGVLPNPGLIEGLAVALAPDEDGDLTAAEWARALRDLGRLPNLNGIFSLGFFSHSGAMAYTVAGAFVDFVGIHYGKPAVRAWYRGQSLEAITKSTWVDLEARFRKYLDTVALAEGTLEAAKARFARPSVLSRTCPHAVDRALERGESMLRQGDGPGACRAFDEARSLDPGEIQGSFGLAECSKRIGNTAEAAKVYESISREVSLPAPVRQRAEELLADLWLERGEVGRAQPIYERLAKLALDSDRRRSLELKANAQSPESVRALTSLLIGSGGEPTWDVAVRDLISWSDKEPNSGIADYLLARNFWHQGREAVAIEHLDRALARSIPLATVKAEALRLRASMACATEDRSTAWELAERLEQIPGLPMPRRRGILRLVERCAGRPLPDPWPETLEQVGTRASGVTTPTQTKPPPQNAGPSAPVPASSTRRLNWDSTEFECPAQMAQIPGGNFWMGSKSGLNSPDESPRFQTSVASFCLDSTEVTVGAYAECVRAGTCTAAASGTTTCNGRHADRLTHPINCVSGEQAVAYCASRGERLPTEIEWEYAARGGPKQLKYPWGDGSPDGRACWKNRMSCPVKTYPAGAFGLFDMTGNVWEWTSSDYSPYPFPARPGEVHQKVYRGGSWSRRFEKWMHVGLRNRWSPKEHGAHLGFRCARSPAGQTCPGDATNDGTCLVAVLAAECPRGQAWNGFRCAQPNAPECDIGEHVERGHGCVRDIPLIIQDHSPDTADVKRKRSPEFDADCQKNQPKRPNSYRYSGGEHEARNIVARRAGCKNRDVGAGWNSTCCP